LRDEAAHGAHHGAVAPAGNGNGDGDGEGEGEGGKAPVGGESEPIDDLDIEESEVPFGALGVAGAHATSIRGDGGREAMEAALKAAASLSPERGDGLLVRPSKGDCVAFYNFLDEAPGLTLDRRSITSSRYSPYPNVVFAVGVPVSNDREITYRPELRPQIRSIPFPIAIDVDQPFAVFKQRQFVDPIPVEITR
jgi:hypothetical protein